MPPKRSSSKRYSSTLFSLQQGDSVRVQLGSSYTDGIVRFIGPTQFSDGEWLGVELQESTGKNNGTVQGVTYFECAENHGVFVRRKQVSKLADSLFPGERRNTFQTAENFDVIHDLDGMAPLSSRSEPSRRRSHTDEFVDDNRSHLSEASLTQEALESHRNLEQALLFSSRSEPSRRKSRRDSAMSEDSRKSDAQYQQSCSNESPRADGREIGLRRGRTEIANWCDILTEEFRKRVKPVIEEELSMHLSSFREQLLAEISRFDQHSEVNVVRRPWKKIDSAPSPILTQEEVDMLISWDAGPEHRVSSPAILEGAHLGREPHKQRFTDVEELKMLISWDEEPLPIDENGEFDQQMSSLLTEEEQDKQNFLFADVNLRSVPDKFEAMEHTDRLEWYPYGKYMLEDQHVLRIVHWDGVGEKHRDTIYFVDGSTLDVEDNELSGKLVNQYGFVTRSIKYTLDDDNFRCRNDSSPVEDPSEWESIVKVNYSGEKRKEEGDECMKELYEQFEQQERSSVKIRI